MSDRLTKERESEIRARLEIGRLPVLGTALDVVAELLAELDALRAAPPTTYQHTDGTEEPIGVLVARLTRERGAHSTRNRAATQAIVDAIGSVGPESVEDSAQRIVARVRELEAGAQKLTERLALVTRQRDEAEARTQSIRDRVRELEAEREAMLVAASEAVGDDRGMDAYTAEEAIRSVVKGAVVERDEARADLAETRAQLARLREAWLDERARLLRVLHGATVRLADGTIGDADLLGWPDPPSTPGPTLAEIRRAAQVEVLRSMASYWSASDGGEPRGTKDVCQWLRSAANNLEAGRG